MCTQLKMKNLTLLLCVPCLVIVACGVERRPLPGEAGAGGEGGSTGTRTTDTSADDSDSDPSAGGSVAQECGWEGEEPDVLEGAGNTAGAPGVWVCHDPDACPAGTYVTWLSDESRSCLACPTGTFSSTWDAESCSEVSEIECRWDQLVVRVPTNDAACQNRSFSVKQQVEGLILDVALDSHENVIALGYYQDNLSHPKDVPSELYLVKYGPTGSRLWQRTVAQSLDGIFRSGQLVLDADDHIYVQPPHECGEVGLTKYDAEGEIVWQRPAAEDGEIWLGDEGEIYARGTAYDERCIEIGLMPVLKRIDSQGNELFALPLHPEREFAVQPDGVLLLADNHLTKYALDDGTQLWRRELSQRVVHMFEGAAGSWLVSTADTLSRVSATGTVLWTIPFEGEGVDMDVALSPDGNWLLVSASDITKISATDGAELWTATRASGLGKSWAFIPEGDLIVADESTLARLSSEDGQERWNLSWDEDPEQDSSLGIVLQVDEAGNVRTIRSADALVTVAKYSAEGAREYSWSASGRLRVISPDHDFIWYSMISPQYEVISTWEGESVDWVRPFSSFDDLRVIGDAGILVNHNWEDVVYRVNDDHSRNKRFGVINKVVFQVPSSQ